MLNGIFPVIPSMFTDEGDLNTEAQRRVIHFALEAGANGVVFPGVASEYSFLTAKERGDLIKLVVNEVDGRVPVVGGASAQTSAEAISLGKEAMSNAISQLMIMAPAQLGDEVARHRLFFAEIAHGLPGCEIILQNAPAPIGAGLVAESIIEIVRDNPAIKYVKEETLPSGPRITTLLKQALPHLEGVFGGGGARYIVDEFRRGAIGAMPAVEMTDLHAALYQAHLSSDEPKMRQLYQLSLPLLTSQTIFRMRLTKYVLQQRGVAHALHVRAPLPELDDFAKRDLDQMLDDLRQSKAFHWTAASA